MPFQHRRSLIACFPEYVYSNAGPSTVLPQLLQSLEADKVLAAQFLRSGRVRLTFCDSDTCDAVLEKGLDYDGVPLRLLPADNRLRTVFLRDIHVETGDTVVASTFSEYGEVLSVEYGYYEAHPFLQNGNRFVKILLSRDIPGFIQVDNFDCQVWYSRQPPQCSVCRASDHRAPACPLPGLCRRCLQPGHMARKCVRAWGPPSSTSASVKPVNAPSCSMDDDRQSYGLK